ncbi:MAG TPA: clostripain-related cysteine peptidase [Pantanalinema sp.]
MSIRRTLSRLATLALSAGMLAGCSAPAIWAPGVQADGTLRAKAAEGDFPASSPLKASTVLSYQAVDNNLQGSLPADLNVMEKVVDPRTMNLLVSADVFAFRFSWARGFEKVSNRDKEGAYRFFVTPDGRDEAYASPYVGLADPDSGSAAHLREFISWGLGKYPGKLRVLDIRSHGHGPLGIADDFHSRSRIFLPELQGAIKQGSDGKGVDVLTTKACLMASVEVGYQLSDSAKYLVASEDGMLTRTGSDSLFYRNLDLLAKSPAITARDFAAAYVTKGMALQQPELRTATTYSAVDLSKVPAAISPIKAMSNALLSLVPSRKAEIQAALAASRNWGRSQTQTDLYDLCEKLEALGDPALTQACVQVRRSLGAAVMVALSDEANRAGMHGLTIMTQLTTGDQAMNEALFAQYKRTAFDREVGWSKVLEALGAFGSERKDHNG